MIDYLGLVGVVLCLIAALATVNVLAPRFQVDVASDRFASIDGARGLAAFFVFMCHAAAWFYFARTGKWAIVPIRAYGNLGQVSVIVFFMITAFLFTSKLQRAGPAGMDWLQLLVSRTLRLVPLYAFAMAVVFLTVAALSGFSMVAPASQLVSTIARWLAFTAWGAPDINGVKDTWMIIAGVTWSLPYELFFYLTLPLLGFAWRVPASWVMVALCTALAAGLFLGLLEPLLAVPFLGGMAATVAARKAAMQAFALTRLASAIVACALCAATALFWGAFKPLPLILVSIAFVLIACGNTIFGVLASRPARLLGEISYSMYLLHGIVLYLLLSGFVGMERLASIPAPLYWCAMLVATPVVVCLCLLTFTLIERPAMSRVGTATRCIRRLFSRPVAARTF